MLPSIAIAVSFLEVLESWLLPIHWLFGFNRRIFLVLMIDVTHFLFLQVLYERRALCENTLQLLYLSLVSAIKESLPPGSNF
jgi:hypothetical protein